MMFKTTDFCEIVCDGFAKYEIFLMKYFLQSRHFWPRHVTFSPNIEVTVGRILYGNLLGISGALMLQVLIIIVSTLHSLESPRVLLLSILY